MSKVLDYIKAALQIAFSLVVLAIILLNFQGLYLATRRFLDRAASVSSIKVLGVEVDLGATAVDQALSLQNVAPDKKSRVLPMIQRLDSKEFIRLMYVGQLKNLCEFENPSTEMRNDAALDYGSCKNREQRRHTGLGAGRAGQARGARKDPGQWLPVHVL